VTAAAIECICEMDIQKGGAWSLPYDVLASTHAHTHIRLAAVQSLMRLHVSRDLAEGLVVPGACAGEVEGNDLTLHQKVKGGSLTFRRQRNPQA
jgi:hypothetical protein